MRLDANLEFAVKQALTATALATNVVDTRGGGFNPNPTINQGMPAILYLVVLATAVPTGSGTIVPTLESDSADTISVDPTVHITGRSVVADALDAGDVLLVAPLPPDDYQEFLGVRFTVSGTVSAELSAFLTLDPTLWKAYKDAAPVGPWDVEESSEESSEASEESSGS